MDVSQLFDELLVRGDVEVVVAGEPEGFLRVLLGDCALEDCEGCGERLGWGLCDQEVDVFRHDDIGIDLEAVPGSGLFQDGEKTCRVLQVSREWGDAGHN